MKLLIFFLNKCFRLQTSVSVHGKGKTTFQSKVFSSSCLFLILRRIVEGLVLGKTQSCWAERQVGKQTFGSSTQLLLNSKYICPDKISYNFMEVLLMGSVGQNNSNYLNRKDQIANSTIWYSYSVHFKPKSNIFSIRSKFTIRPNTSWLWCCCPGESERQ